MTITMELQKSGSNSGLTQPTRLSLQIWHPNCWTLRVTDAVDAGLISHGVYEINDAVRARATAYGDTQEDLDELIEAIDASELTDEIRQVTDFSNPAAGFDVAGNTTTELIVRYEPKNSIHDAFVSRGFVPDRGIRVYDGYEYWTVIAEVSRKDIKRRIAEVEREMNAEITIKSIQSSQVPEHGFSCESDEFGRLDRLSERQREAFELARREGYYTWPRETSVSELAEEIDVTKTTLLEHLRKAEAKLLGQQ